LRGDSPLAQLPRELSGRLLPDTQAPS
jgi:hypothetical protein